MCEMKIKFELPFLGISSKEYSGMSFGRQLEYRRKIEKWKSGAKVAWISQKRRTNASAIKEFKSLYQPKEYYTSFHDSKSCRDDSIQIYYT